MAERHDSRDPVQGSQSSASELDRRRGDRRDAAGHAAVHPDSIAIRGRLRDVSPGGLFVELERDLVVEVEFDEGGERPVRRAARLVRCQRMPGGRSGFALEFLER